eukprot:TRINITY_DN10482_c0_g1_i3.p1 TRINITY_DN10482_c0_g1~~TRINITY_DN10482_c0_g1_i3.p1  ORF type:complete len:619 (+),score=92.33 TRINITY_DN10482_c0_g1_i3:74-1930(+)
MSKQIAYCTKNELAACVAESSFGVLPFFAFIYFGFKAFKDIKDETAHIPQTGITTIHAIKSILVVSLMNVPLIFMILHLFTPTIYIIFCVHYGSAAVSWLGSLVILRSEYKKNGYTSKHLRIFWIIAFVSNTLMILVSDIDSANKSGFDWDEVIVFTYEVLLALLVLFSLMFTSDIPGEPEPDKSLHYKSIKEVKFRQRKFVNSVPTITDSYTSDNHPSVAVQKEESVAKSDIWSKFASYSYKNHAIGLDEDNHDDESIMEESFLNESRNGKRDEMSDISIVRWDDLFRDGKRSTLYVIRYYLEGEMVETKRSYSEFLALYKDMQKIVLDVDFPPFPEKKRQQDSFDPQVLRQRKDGLNYILQFFMSEPAIKASFKFNQFLKSNDAVPHYGRTLKGNQTGKDAEEATINESIKESVKESERTDESAKLKSKDDMSFVPETSAAKRETPHIERSQTVLLTSNDDYKNLGVDRFMKNPLPRANSVVESYDTSLSVLDQKKDKKLQYVVEILRTITKKSGLKSKTYYEIDILDREKKKTFKIIKSYSEFRDLHQDFKSSLKRNNITLPELPYKGSINFFTPKMDNKVVEYRKVALRSYLQFIVNDPELLTNPRFQIFLNQK